MGKYIYIILLILSSIFMFISCQEDANSVNPDESLLKNNAPSIINLNAAVEETLTPFIVSPNSESYSGMLVEGTGMVSQPGNISFTIPNGVDIKKVFIYWVGKGNTLANGGDNTILVDGIPVIGDLIGTTLPLAGANIIRFSYRADITELPLDLTSVELSGLQFNGSNARSDGAGIVVLYGDNSNTSEVVIHDGADFAWLCAADGSPIESYFTNEQTFMFNQSSSIRNAVLTFMVGDSESPDRPDRINITINGITNTYDQKLIGSAGEEFDVVKIPITIPIGIDEIKVSVESGPGDCGVIPIPESLVWIFGGLSIENPRESFGCTYTQGYWKNHPEEWPLSSLKLGNTEYSKTQLLSILKTPVRGNGLISLAHQLITSKLNKFNGADDSSISVTISDADILIGNLVVPPIGNGQLRPNATSSLVEKLDSYNNGAIGPGHCN